ncbi:MAG TPA: transcriptional regulator [Prolixibacteraceae bacterium]|nr:MAG: transcriptional regulator [Bacteroidetes bacterium GWA2_42_15]OFX98991.1 MAG: transcriptional regulator [Bacteroidetes bacterium GWE2_42_39]HBL77228.1 transcriptional regulator [Prolixibacteraceae bacterium]HCR90075.1 transcriptional regulator [Prolixibacteraceae bacterium]HCU63794.1 transcriptional regulator [Prolixibacteraceae bacterium]
MKNLLQQLDKAFENKIRLGAMSVLRVNSEASFNDLKELLEVTDGNLASHLKHLEKEGYISVKKSFINRKPNTVYTITETGKTAFEKHLETLEEILKQR